MSGPAVVALMGAQPVQILLWCLAVFVVVVGFALALKILGISELVFGKVGAKFGKRGNSSMAYVRAMLNVDRQRHEIDAKAQNEARRKTRDMVDVVIAHVLAVEMIELRHYIGEVDARWRDLSFRSLLRGEVKDEIMYKTMQIYELNGLGELSEIELAAKIDRDIKAIVPSVSDIIRDGWANTDITWDQLNTLLMTSPHKDPIKQAFVDCIKEFRNISLKKMVEYERVNNLIAKIEEAANAGLELPPGCFDGAH